MEYILDICKVLGIKVYEIINGQPITTNLNDSEKSLVNKLMELDDINKFLSIDLENDSFSSEVKSILSDGKFDKLKKYQCDLIREYRRRAYLAESDGLYFDAEYSGSSEKLQEWKDKVAEIKARYPWPGDYR